jgi:hypothetical protein
MDNTNILSSVSRVFPWIRPVVCGALAGSVSLYLKCNFINRLGHTQWVSVEW